MPFIGTRRLARRPWRQSAFLCLGSAELRAFREDLRLFLFWECGGSTPLCHSSQILGAVKSVKVFFAGFCSGFHPVGEANNTRQLLLPSAKSQHSRINKKAGVNCFHAGSLLVFSRLRL